MDLIEIVLAMKGVQGFVAQANEASEATAKVGTTAEETGKKGVAGWKGMVKYAAGFAAVYGAARFLEGSVNQTEQLAKSTHALQVQTGMDATTASEWIAVTKQRGVSAKQFQVGLVKLSKTMEQSRTGTLKETSTVAALRAQIDQVAAAGGKTAPAQLTKLSNAIASAQAAGTKARATLQALGVPLADLQKGDTQATLLKVADALKAMKDPAERAALAQQLFGRSGVQMLPVLMQGRAGIEKLLDEQKKQGNYLTGQGVKSTLAMVQQQRALEDSLNGVKTQLTLALLPALVGFGKGLLAVMNFLRPITSNAKLLRIVLLALVGTLILYKTTTMAVALAENVAKIATAAWTAAQWLLNAALDANPIALVIIAVAALVAGFVLAYEKVGWFHDAVDAAFKAVVSAAQYVIGWFKSNWLQVLATLIAGPFGLAAVEIYKNFGVIKQTALAVIAAIRQAIADLVGWVSSLPTKIGKTLSKIPGVHAAEAAGGAVGGLVRHLAAGGVIHRPGVVLVGERGPELLTLPSAATVTPLPDPGAFGGGRFQRPLQLTTQVILDRKVVAQAVAAYTSDKLARA